jgi:activator of 2-hydroxyglutaryl-CoA dehydratase/benzoyl-CoA reductase/2-hydroxyglutaryl-CoA dehydratase subunit BcrC/BadD/HgdB
MIQPNRRKKDSKALFLGIDIGSTTIKAVLINEKRKVHHSLYQRTKAAETPNPSCGGRCSACGTCHLGSLRETIRDFLSCAGATMKDVLCTAVTGSQVVEDTRRFLPYDIAVSEVSAHFVGAQHGYPDCKAILDVGGQDSKAMLYSEPMKIWVSKMSGICAAGTGAFLDSVAAKLGIPVEEMAGKVNYDSDLQFSSVCAVLSATSVNKFKNRHPIGDIIAGACRAQARTVMSGVGEMFFNYKGDILFQGGVASNPAVAYYLREITGNNIVIPEFHRVMGALGAACLAHQYYALKDTLAPRPLPAEAPRMDSISMRASSTRREFFSKSDAPLVWRNLFFPTEILNALGVRSLTLETYAALFARNQKRVKKAFDNAACKGFSAETCSFLRVLEGSELPRPAFAVSTSAPCQQGERIFQDLARSYGIEDRCYSLQTPVAHDDRSLEHIAAGLEEAVHKLEKATGLKMDPARLVEACQLSNEAREVANQCNLLRLTSPPLVRGSIAVYFANVFSQLWGRQDLVDIQKQFLRELTIARERIGDRVKLEDTHRLGWLHLPPFYDTKLLDYIEDRCQAPIILEEVNFVGWEYLDLRDPYRALARKLLSVGFLDPKLRVKYIRDGTVFGQFNGCILYNHGFGRCSMSDSCFVKHLREELQRVPVPLLQLDGDCVDPTIDPCSTYTKVNAYVEGLNIQRFGNPFGPLDESLPGRRSRPHLQELHETSNRIIHFIRDYSRKIHENLS